MAGMAHAAATASRRIAIVTGAAQGIGKCIALRLARDGLVLAVNDLAAKRATLQDVVAEIQAGGGEAIAVPADVSVEGDVQAMTAHVVEKLGGIDVMIANAAVTGPIKPLVEVTSAEWDATMMVDLRGTMLSYKYAALQMIKQGRGGRIIGASSMVGKQGVQNGSAYSAAKFAIRGLTHSAAKELAQHKITVNAYAPGFILTELTMLPQDAVNGGPGSTLKKIAGWPSSMPAAEPEVVASLVSHLVKPESYFITGQTITVDGGFQCD
ncbi:NAD(P)-binding protein [Wolfiporia cocos MD-104 SS10]|uniref:NAD(P)-binding protein n=1 Tax=Wolfiporia cocos (strain MD-104) TaxID=742152 RepID=A0A2H3JSB1_WOLCO|nr:NAD(P)-binding protein [Wolfiporia cocos MD-104 SS10]